MDRLSDLQIDIGVRLGRQLAAGVHNVKITLNPVVAVMRLIFSMGEEEAIPWRTPRLESAGASLTRRQ
jgi:hypothetical protein